MSRPQAIDAPVKADAVVHVSARAWAALQEHRIAPSPQNYELLFMHFAGTSAEISERLGSFLAGGEAPSAGLLQGLWGDVCGRTHNAAMTDALGQGADAIAEAAQGLVEQVANSQAGLRSYGETLTTMAKRLDAKPTVESLMQTFAVLAAETSKAGERNRRLEQELSASAGQIADLRRDLVRIRHEATTDGLTGIANRKSFDARLSRAVQRAGTEPGCTFSLLMIDVDHFKQFNDRYGHRTGDLVLRLVGKLLSDNVKGRDTAARYGGEEFAVLLDGADSKAAASVAQQLCERLAHRRLVKRNTGESVGQITCSIGVAQHAAGESGAALIERADQALYVAKHTGRNRVSIAAER